MEVIAEKPWSWMLFATGDRLFLSVVCGGVGVYDVDLELTVAEAASYRQIGKAYIDELANAIRAKPAEFESRWVAGLLSDERSRAAVTVWRQKRSIR
jgi:hypothetical protein